MSVGLSSRSVGASAAVNCRSCRPGRLGIKPCKFQGFWGCASASWRVADTLLRGLCGLFRDMLCSTSVGYGRVPAGNGLVVADCHAPVASASNSNHTNAHTTPQTVEKLSSGLREPEPSEQIRITTTGPPDDHDQTYENIRSQVFLLAIDRPADTRICNELLAVVHRVEFGQGRQGLLPAEVGGGFAAGGLLPARRSGHRCVAGVRRCRGGFGGCCVG